MNFLYHFNQFLWSGPVIFLLLGLHIYFTFHLGFVQKHIGKGIRFSLSDSSPERSSHDHRFSAFGSLTTTLAATLGTGNIVGISTAVYLGGPGAVFWCWVTGLFGMATTYAETYLSAKYQTGPIRILNNHLKKKFFALLYSLALCLSAFCIGCTTQSNAITDSLNQVFQIPPAISAIATAFLVGLILIQGRHWIEKFSMAVVPTMAIFFLGGCILYLILHRSYVPAALSTIVKEAFGVAPIAGGLTGFTMKEALRYGVARGLFTNEAGLGTAGIIAGNCDEKKPQQQGLVSMSASFWDTVVLCAVTGIMLVAYQIEYVGTWNLYSPGSLCAAAFSALPFWGDEILAVAIFSFALATLVGWSYLGMEGFSFLFKKGQIIYLTFYLIMIFVGGILPLTLVWELTDCINLLLLIPSVYLLVKCRREIRPPKN